MADEIEIVNFGDGGVASEATLKALVSAVEKMGGSGKGAKVQEMHNKAVESGIKVSTKNRDALSNNTKGVKKSTKAVSQFSNKLKGAVLGGLGAVANGLVGLGNELLNGGSGLSDFTQHIPIVNTLLGPFAGYLDNSINSFRQLSNVGASFGNSLESMRRAAASSGLSLDEYTSFVGQNSETLRLFGGTVTQGVAGFNALSKQLKKTGQFNELKAMGFTILEINEGLAGYASLQSRLGRLQGQSTTELANGSANYLKQLDQLAKITGKSRQEMENVLAQQAADASFRAMARKLEGDELANFQSSMAVIETIGGSTAIALKDLADGVPQTDEAFAFIAQAGPEFQQIMTQVANGADPQILIDALEGAATNIDAQADNLGAAGITAVRSSNAAYGSILDESYRLREVATANTDAALDEQRKRDETTEKLANFDTAIASIRETIQIALLDSGIFDTLSSAFAGAAGVLQDTLASESFRTSVQELADKFKAFLADIQDVGFSEAIKNIFKDVDFGQMIKDFLFGSKPNDSEGGTGTPSGPDAASGGDSSGGLLGGLFGDISALEVGAGVVGGLLAAGGIVFVAVKGFQALLAGFGTGPVALGVAVFTGMLIGTGAAIKLAGEGISAAGDGIGKVAAGVERLAGMEDTANFENIADALGKIGPALISLTAGGVLDSITSFFGADSPFEKLRDGINEFGEIEPTAIANLKTAGEGLTTFTTISDNLDAGPITRYAEAVENLAESMEKLNDALADKNNDWGESGMSVGNMLSNGQTLGGGSGTSEEKINQLNNTMQQAVAALTDIKQINTRQLTALNGMGDVY